MIDFSHASYLELIAYLREKEYFVGSFREFPDSGPAVILRHDIDFSIVKSLEMARLDTEAGVHSSFFVLMTAPIYNALAQENIASLKSIVKLGHEIGLHYDCSLFDDMTQEQMGIRVKHMAQMLGEVLDVEISSVAQHKPSAAKIRPHFPEFRDAYSSAYFKDIAYLSDSRMVFGTGDVYAFFDKNPRSQLLIHPVWWNKRPLSRREIFDGLGVEIRERSGLHIEIENQQIEDSLRTRTISN
jgi:hypothetical protein